MDEKVWRRYNKSFALKKIKFKVIKKNKNFSTVSRVKVTLVLINL